MYVLYSGGLIVLKQREEMMNDNVDACFNEIEYVIDNIIIYVSIKQTLINDVIAYVENLIQKIMKY
jgi:hypothetical protein